MWEDLIKRGHSSAALAVAVARVRRVSKVLQQRPQLAVLVVMAWCLTSRETMFGMRAAAAQGLTVIKRLKLGLEAKAVVVMAVRMIVRQLESWRRAVRTDLAAAVVPQATIRVVRAAAAAW